ncbi:hypothetical protein PHMEG_00010530 [Phytophthora megakarya]|uniref:Uncharacterized protein n=1 Tax=Phytophthora megakarya TaxID=4795 RepID=A0A225WF73_9STRA|nr:hypothetical protein PHMEG_00010530 [Phytophthora megakarya]
MKKTKTMTAEGYDSQFQPLVQLEKWVPPGDGVPMTVGNQYRYFSAGMPRSWQASVVP